MKFNLIRTLWFVVTLFVSISVFSQAKNFESLQQALYAGRILRGDREPADLNWIYEGNAYSYTKTIGRSKEIWILEPGNNRETLIFSTKEQCIPNSQEPFEFKSYQWTGDNNHLLFQTDFSPIWRYSGNADYYLYSLQDKSLKLITEQAFTAEMSPDGQLIGYGKDGDLYIYNLKTSQNSRLTDDARENFYNGRFGWAYEEEFGLVQAWEWSPDSRYIAFWQSDETGVPIYSLTDFAGIHPQYLKIPYPKVGDHAPEVKIGVINVGTLQKSWLEIDIDDGYIPRIYWTSRADILAVLWMNRAQNHLKLYFFNVKSGKRTLIMEERADAWLDIYDFWNRELHYFRFPAGLEEFFFISDRDGYSHIYRYDYEGHLINQVTEGEWEVIKIEAINTDESKLYYLSTEVSPLERNLYSVKFDGTSRKRITLENGNHSVEVSPSGIYLIDRYSDINNPSRTELKDRKGKVVEVLSDNQDVQEFMRFNNYCQSELFRFTTRDGVAIDGSLIKPGNFDPGKVYPLIMAVYGGPGSQGVKNEFSSSGWEQYLAQQGFVVANINNRGNGGYGRDFEKIVYKQLGKYETADFAEAAEYLSSKPWIDEKRTAIMGHSYGGFSAGYSIVMHPDVFEAAIATAAVDNQILYDCIYAERHMGLINENYEGYLESSISAHAGQLEGNLMLVHSLLDDNVHPQNTFHMLSAFLNHGKSVDLKIYPAGNHGVAYDWQTRILLYHDYYNFLTEKLNEY